MEGWPEERAGDASNLFHKQNLVMLCIDLNIDSNVHGFHNLCKFAVWMGFKPSNFGLENDTRLEFVHDSNDKS